MEYKASMDTLCKVITTASVILFIFIGQSSVRAVLAAKGDSVGTMISSGVVLLLVAILAISYIYAPQKYVIMNEELTIHRPAGNKVIRFADIAEVRPVDRKELRGTIRTFGNGGLFGYYGKYYNSKMGSMKWYITQRKNIVLIKTKDDKKILVSPDDMTFIERFSGLAQYRQ